MDDIERHAMPTERLHRARRRLAERLPAYPIPDRPNAARLTEAVNE